MSQTTSEQIVGTWEIDPAHSEVAFVVRHLMSKVRGIFTSFSGTIQTPSDDLTQATVEVTIDVSSVSTNNEQRDGHLKTADVFNAEQFPTITFRSTGITAKGGDAYTITGDLTVTGVTKSVDLEAEFFGVDVDAYGVTRLGAEARTQIVRKEFGVNFNIPLDGGRALIGDKVDIELSVEATKS
ncbi:YceI family protein [Naumannella halotolerans]|uniref:YceI family protein n=1 Tax=Naumannella halotolerans TaxID=993414 RepID=UPI00370D3DC9